MRARTCCPAARQLVGRGGRRRRSNWACPGGRQLVLAQRRGRRQGGYAHGAGGGEQAARTPSPPSPSSSVVAASASCPDCAPPSGGRLQAVEPPSRSIDFPTLWSQCDGDARIGDGQLDSGEDGGTVDDQPHPHQLVEGRSRHRAAPPRLGARDRRRRGPRCPPGPPHWSPLPTGPRRPGTARGVGTAGPAAGRPVGKARAGRRTLGAHPGPATWRCTTPPARRRPADLALGVGAAVVADPHLVDPAAGTGRPWR